MIAIQVFFFFWKGKTKIQVRRGCNVSVVLMNQLWVIVQSHPDSRTWWGSVLCTWAIVWTGQPWSLSICSVQSSLTLPAPQVTSYCVASKKKQHATWMPRHRPVEYSSNITAHIWKTLQELTWHYQCWVIKFRHFSKLKWWENNMLEKMIFSILSIENIIKLLP